MTALTRNEIRTLQGYLSQHGFYEGPIDGSVGPNTVRASREWISVYLPGNYALDSIIGYARRLVGLPTTGNGEVDADIENGLRYSTPGPHPREEARVAARIVQSRGSL